MPMLVRPEPLPVCVPENVPPVMVPLRVGEAANTAAPVPVSSVNALVKFAEVDVARNAATPDAKPLTPVLIGRPVAFVSVPEVGVPSAPENVTSPLAAFTAFPSAVSTPVPAPANPVEIGKPVAFVSVPDVGIPSAPENVTRPLAAFTAFPSAVITPVPAPLNPVAIGRPVAFVKVTDVGVPSIGVTKVGEVASTTFPVPVDAVVHAIAVPLVAVQKLFVVSVPKPTVEFIPIAIQFVSLQ